MFTLQIQFDDSDSVGSVAALAELLITAGSYNSSESDLCKALVMVNLFAASWLERDVNLAPENWRNAARYSRALADAIDQKLNESK